MFRFISLLLLLVPITSEIAQAQEKYSGIGRLATPAEIKAWDIDVRPDFAGLPPGSGSVANGQQVWESKCASCHGTFGESNEVFSPLVGGTTAEDIKIGRVKALREPVARTTLMKVSSIATLWDYINRAMPWNAPKSLTTDEVYASLAYMLYLGDIVPSDFVLTDRTIRDVQERLPNRHGMVKYDDMWSVRGRGDVRNVACMKNCKIETGMASALPDFARDTHGNLADQQRAIGQERGRLVINSIAGVPSKPAVAASFRSAASQAPVDTMLELSRSNNCATCHQVDRNGIGPSFVSIATKYKGDMAAESKLTEKVKNGGGGVWGPIPMPPNPIRDEVNRALVKWILAGATGP